MMAVVMAARVRRRAIMAVMMARRPVVVAMMRRRPVIMAAVMVVMVVLRLRDRQTNAGRHNRTNRRGRGLGGAKAHGERRSKDCSEYRFHTLLQLQPGATRRMALRSAQPVGLVAFDSNAMARVAGRGANSMAPRAIVQAARNAVRRFMQPASAAPVWPVAGGR
ncbi:hypothetical protein ACERNI_01735 [Camelimonas sp. ID_303_24]